jgi:hypothetical protein
MSYVDLFGLGREALQQGLDRPRFTIASGVPDERGGFIGTPLLQQRRVEALFEFHAPPRNTRGISRLAGLPSVRISRFELGFRIAGLAKFEFTACRHEICSGLTSGAARAVEFGTDSVCRGEKESVGPNPG